MSRLIDADELMEILRANRYYPFGVSIDEVPTVDAEPVRHGYWIDVNYDGSLWRCSVCGETQCCKSNYCADCGAKMEK